MTAIFFTLVGIGLIVVQTAILPLIGTVDRGYDLLVPLVVFLGLRPRVRDSLPVAVLLGLAVDNLSGAPPGYHLTAYLWIYLAIRWLIRFLRVTGTFLLPLAIAGAVGLEHLVLLGFPLLLARAPGPPPGPAVETVAYQVVWALLTGPLLYVAFTALQRRIDRYQEQARARRAVQDE